MRQLMVLCLLLIGCASLTPPIVVTEMTGDPEEYLSACHDRFRLQKSESQTIKDMTLTLENIASGQATVRLANELLIFNNLQGKKISTADTSFVIVVINIEEEQASFCIDLIRELEEDDCKSKKASVQRDCYLDIGRLKGIDACEQISDTTMQNECYSGAFHALKEDSTCEAFSGSRRESCLFNVAFATGDYQPCLKLAYPDNCLNSVVGKSLDPSICQHFTAKLLKEECIKITG